MKITIIITIFNLTICNLIPIYSQVPHNNLKITYIANEGFLFTSSTKKVLIDALFTVGYGAFPVPSQETLSKIKDANAPFDSISLYMLTHYHKDHCDPVLVYDYLKKNKELPLVTNKPSIVFINGNCFDFILLKKQFNELTPEINQSISKTINNIPVKAFGIKHLSMYKNGIDMEENMFNSSYLFEMDGINVFHSGDIKITDFQDYILKNEKWTDKVDVACLYYDLFNSGVEDLNYILKTLNPKYIVIMHVPLKKIESTMLKIEELKNRYPNILFFKNSLDTEMINFTNIKN